MQTQYVHPRLGLPKFLVFEPFIRDAIEAFDRGQDTKITVNGGLSQTTVAARLRDSLLGFRLNHRSWQPRVDPVVYDLLLKHDGKFVIAGPDANGEIWFRQRRKTGNPNIPVQFNEVEGQLDKHMRTSAVARVNPPAQTALRAKDCNIETIRSFAMLRAAGQLDLPVIFPGPISPDIESEIVASHDVAFHYDQQRNETVLV